MGITDNINRALFTLTYNEKASQAYDDQNAKAAGAVDDLKKIIQRYRETREKIINADEASEYFSFNSLARITEWENWLEKNAGLAAGDYSKKETEMKTQWESIVNVNKMVKEMGRVSEFITLYMKEKEIQIPTDQKKELNTLKTDAETYYSKINNQTPADIVAKRDEFNKRFDDIQKKIPENFEDLKEPFENNSAPTGLIKGIEENNFNTYKDKVNNKEIAEQNSFNMKRLLARTMEYSSMTWNTVWPYFFGTLFAMIVANDAIARPVMIRVFYFVFMFILFNFSIIPFFPVLVFVYYVFRWGMSFDWSTFSFDSVKAPVLFAFLPLFELKEDSSSFTRYIFSYNINAYDNLIQKKKMAYEIERGAIVGKKLDAGDFGLEEETFNSLLCDLKSVALGTPRGSFKEVLESIKKLV